jgi:hypothetical protein
MPLVVTSAAGANGDGYGALLAFDDDGNALGPFTRDSRIADPRGLAVNLKDGLLFINGATDRVLAIDRNGVVVRDSGPINGLNPGGGNFGPDGRYYVGLRSAHTIMAFTPGLDGRDDHILPLGIVPFLRGFACDADGRLFLASGMGPDGIGDNSIVAFALDRQRLAPFAVRDAELSPLDLAEWSRPRSLSVHGAGPDRRTSR